MHTSCQLSLHVRDARDIKVYKYKWKSENKLKSMKSSLDCEFGIEQVIKKIES